MKLAACIIGALILGCCVRAALALDQTIPAELLKAEVIVTGKGEAERARGFREGLTEIFIKLAGNPAIADGDRLAPFLNEASAYISGFTYEDRMKNLPVRDEQGTRDRPHFLRMTADALKIETAIKSLGFEIWLSRPEIDVYLTVTDPRRTFIVGAETEKPVNAFGYPIPIASARYDGYEQREVLKSIANHRGLKINLPNVTRLERQSGGIRPLDAGAQSSKLNTLMQLFGWDRRSAPGARYRGYLIAIPSGGWRLKVTVWGYSFDAYLESPACFAFEIAEPSFDTALRKSLDAFTAWIRRDRNAINCGLPTKS